MVARGSGDLGVEAREFLREYHIGTLATLRSDGTPHVAAVGFTVDADVTVARVITSGASQKALNVTRTGYAALTQVDGARWLTLEGRARILDDPEAVADAERRYAERYRTPRDNPRRIVVEVSVDRVMGSARMFTARG